MKTKQIILGEVEGTYESDNYKIYIGRTGAESRVLCNGKELGGVNRVLIVIEAGCPTKVILSSYETGEKRRVMERLRHLGYM